MAGVNKNKKFDKGQLISKGLLGFFDSPKKGRKNFCPIMLGQKLAFSSSFFWRDENTFEINWTLVFGFDQDLSYNGSLPKSYSHSIFNPWSINPVIPKP